MLAKSRYVYTADLDRARINRPYTCDCVKRCGFARAVAANDCTEVAFFKLERNAVEGFLFVYSSCVERLFNAVYLKHFPYRLSLLCFLRNF